VDGSYHIHPHQALLREVLFLRPNQELARRLRSFWVLRKRVDAEEALEGGESVGGPAWQCCLNFIQPPTRCFQPKFNREKTGLRVAGTESYEHSTGRCSRGLQGPPCLGGCWEEHPRSFSEFPFSAHSFRFELILRLCGLWRPV
jgi:hypothetical protein